MIELKITAENGAELAAKVFSLASALSGATAPVAVPTPTTTASVTEEQTGFSLEEGSVKKVKTRKEAPAVVAEEVKATGDGSSDEGQTPVPTREEVQAALMKVIKEISSDAALRLLQREPFCAKNVSSVKEEHRLAFIEACSQELANKGGE